MGRRENVTLSVVVPLYNQSRFVAEAMLSLQAQTMSNWECIVVDDGSTDGAEKVVRQLADRDDRIIYLRQDNRGPSAARNAGIAVAKAPYFQFLDADDLLEAGKLELHVSHLERAPDDDVVYGDARYFTDGNPTERFFGIWGEQGPWIEELARSNEPIVEKVLRRNLMPTDCPVFRRSVLERVGPWDEAVFGCEDWDYWIRCVAEGVRFRYLPGRNALALVRSHAFSTSRDLSRMADGECRFRVKVGGFLRGNAHLRMLNFEKAANRLDELNPPDYRGRLFQLAKANAAARVFLYALLRMVDRRNLLRTVARSARAVWRRAVGTPVAPEGGA